MKTTVEKRIEEIPDGSATMIARKPAEPAEPTTIHPTAVLGQDVALGRGAVIGPKVVIEDGARIGDRVKLYAGVYVGKRCQIGDDCVIDPQVTIREGCILGRGVRVFSGAVIGSDGFGFAQESNGNRHKIPQIGIVEIGSGAVIGANCTIDRATLGRTVIGPGAVVQGLVQIGHNVRVGEGTVIGAQSGICGSSTIGAGVRVGCSVGMVGHIKVEDRCTIEDFSGISKSVPADSQLTGYPAISPEQMTRRRQMEEELPRLYERVKKIEKSLNGNLVK